VSALVTIVSPYGATLQVDVREGSVRVTASDVITPLTSDESRALAAALVTAAELSEGPRELRRPTRVEEALRDREGGV
jgi:hypothetical protein